VNNVEPLAVTISLGLDRARIFLRGELDLGTAPLLRKGVDDVLGKSGEFRSLVLVDMDELTFCDSSGIRVLLEIADQCRRVGTNLRISNVPDNIRRVLEMSGASSALNIDSALTDRHH